MEAVFLRACRSMGQSCLINASTSATATRISVLPSFSWVHTVSWSKSRESSLSSEHQSKWVRSTISEVYSALGPDKDLSCNSALTGNSGSRSRSSMARVAMRARSMRVYCLCWGESVIDDRHTKLRGRHSITQGSAPQ